MYASSAIELIDKARTEWLKLHGDEDPIIKLVELGQYGGVVEFSDYHWTRFVRVGFVDGKPQVIRSGNTKAPT